MKRRGKAAVMIITVFILALSGQTVAFAESGWVPRDSSWYYYYKDGTLASNQWVISNGNQFWINEDGTMAVSQWVETDGIYYYVGADGSAVTDWNEIDGKWYYFYKSDTNKFMMAVDTQIDGRKVGKDGAWVPIAIQNNAAPT